MLLGEPDTGIPSLAVIGPTVLSAVLGQLQRELGAVIVFASLHRIVYLSSVCCIASTDANRPLRRVPAFRHRWSAFCFAAALRLRPTTSLSIGKPEPTTS
jgi:hypothetical protein